eukprot:1345020-Rhodomonas_salina.1
MMVCDLGQLAADCSRGADFRRSHASATLIRTESLGGISSGSQHGSGTRWRSTLSTVAQAVLDICNRYHSPARYLAEANRNAAVLLEEALGSRQLPLHLHHPPPLLLQLLPAPTLGVTIDADGKGKHAASGSRSSWPAEIKVTQTAAPC